MKQVKAGQPLIDFIELCYHANQPVLLVGKHGVGKSELLEQAAQQLGTEFICRDLSLMEPPDLVGLPNLAGATTSYRPPSFLPTVGKGLLVFEELNRCERYMRAPCLQLLTARTLNDYVLPEGWLPVAAINPHDDNYDVQELDPALLSRFVKAQVVPDRAEWLQWANEKGLHESVLGYVDSDSKIFTDTSPRDWTKVAQLMRVGEEKRVKQATLDLAIAGVVGRERLIGFKAHLKGGPPLPKIRDVIDNYDKYKKQVEDWTEKGQTDNLESLCYSLKVFLQDPDVYSLIRNKPIRWNNLGSFLSAIPPDLAGDVAEFMTKHNYEIPRYGPTN